MFSVTWCACLYPRYTSGDVRLWDTLNWDSTASYLKINSLSANSEPRPYVRYVQVNSTVAAATYEDGECVFMQCDPVVNDEFFLVIVRHHRQKHIH